MCCKLGDLNVIKFGIALWMFWLIEVVRELKVISKVRINKINYWYNLKVIYIKILFGILDVIIKMFLKWIYNWKIIVKYVKFVIVI